MRWFKKHITTEERFAALSADYKWLQSEIQRINNSTNQAWDIIHLILAHIDRQIEVGKTFPVLVKRKKKVG
jgi:hypothetical protein